MAGVGGVVHRDPPHPDTVAGQHFQRLVERLRVPGDHHRSRSVDRGDLDPARPRSQPRGHVLFGERDRGHAAATGQRRGDGLTPQRHHLRGILKRQRTRHTSRGNLTLRVPDHRVGHDTDRRPHRRETHHHREARGLQHVDPIQEPGIGIATQHVHKGPVHPRRQRCGALGDPLGEHRRGVEEFATHPGPLGALAREHPHQLARLVPAAGDETGRGLAARQGIQPRQRFLAGTRHHDGPLSQHRPARHQRPGHAREGAVLDGRGQPAGLSRQRPGAARRHHQRHHTRGRRLFGGWLLGCLLQDHVRVRPADPERRHPGPARPAVARPVAGLGQQLHRTRGPVHLGRGRVHVQRRRQDAVFQGLDHLDHTGHPGSRLRVPDVRLQRPQPQRLPGLPVLPVGRQQRLRLDRVTQRGPGAVRLHRVHIGRCEAGTGECAADHPLLGQAVRRGQAVRGAVLVHRRTTQHREDPVPAFPRHRQPLQHDHARALSPAGAVGG